MPDRAQGDASPVSTSNPHPLAAVPLLAQSKQCPRGDLSLAAQQASSEAKGLREINASVPSFSIAKSRQPSRHRPNTVVRLIAPPGGFLARKHGGEPSVKTIS